MHPAGVGSPGKGRKGREDAPDSARSGAESAEERAGTGGLGDRVFTPVERRLRKGFTIVRKKTEPDAIAADIGFQKFSFHKKEPYALGPVRSSNVRRFNVQFFTHPTPLDDPLASQSLHADFPTKRRVLSFHDFEIGGKKPHVAPLFHITDIPPLLRSHSESPTGFRPNRKIRFFLDDHDFFQTVQAVLAAWKRFGVDLLEPTFRTDDT